MKREILLQETAGGSWSVYTDGIKVDVYRRYSDAVSYCNENNMKVTIVRPWRATTPTWTKR